MLTKYKKINLTKYLDSLTDKFQSLKQGDVPEKHKGHPESYKLFLVREMDAVKKLLEQDQLERIDR